ncbi:sensor domain-containing protein [Thiocystis violascens]|uniref:PAS domain S-box/diguanylate cyclase (GGDEF) domain-containing protein n=1 Tax=Thiocystis violascens (strain ATCC 17096 / DSM 198 / 6111) TaxID=765911 RepID=I3YBM5_THIV6|nr:EAL domain-containing protein [Thiocystis violascens]AFL74393.1 PAS domain S-box/diguanylate cyclase (GGDEF) domain-containing protein [Thiocystis violascens DSM 198]
MSSPSPDHALAADAGIADCVDLWQALIEGLIEAVWLVDPFDLRIVAANRVAVELLGMTRETMVGRPVIDLACTPEDLFFWEDVAAGRADHLLSETLLRHRDQTLVTVLRRVSRVKCANGLSFYVVGIANQSEQRAVENELEKLVAELRATLESTADGILVTDLDGAIRGFNQGFAEMWKLPEALLTERDDAGVYGWMARSVLDPGEYAARIAAIGHDPLLEASDVLALRHGTVLERVTLPQYARGHPIGRVYSFRDITQRLADEKRLTLANRVFEASLDAIFVTDPEFRIMAVNPACERMTDCRSAELAGQALTQSLQLWLGDRPHRAILDALARDGFWQGEIAQRTKTGLTFPCLVSLVRVLDAEGAPFHYVGFVKDLSEAVAARQRIEQLAYTDTLTGLPNRFRLTERLEFAINLAQRERTGFALLFIDIDRFKQINDSLGHIFGDRVLIEVAQRITHCLRQVDTTARLGGDEFVLLLHQASEFGAEQTARRLLEVMTQPFAIDGMKFSLTFSIGIALYPDDGESADDLIKNADSAMYHVKERGRGHFRFYRPQMNVDLLTRMKLDHAMREALAEQRFRLAYQPQVDLRTGRVIGVEALLRWRDRELGEISPGQFIPIAEETGFIVALGDWVLREAIRQGEQWHLQGIALTMSVNVSAVQFQQTTFIASLAHMLAASRLPPGRLELELTESILIQNVDDTLVRLDALVALGVRLAIDDFGTGYSNLAYLKRFPLHRLKIDRSFVRDLPDDESDAAIATAVINLARALKLRVIAEGVENDTQRDFLLAAGCDEFQGFLCAPALKPADFLNLAERIGLADATPLPTSAPNLETAH